MTPSPTRIVVTGLGIVCPLGTGVETAWSRALAGDSTCARIRAFDASNHLVQIACEVPDFEPMDYMDAREARRLDPTVRFALAASRQAVADAELALDAIDRDRVGVIFGSGIGGLHTLETGFEALHAQGPTRVSPMTSAMMIPDMAAGYIAIALGARGPNFCVVSACATGAHSLGEAAEVLRRGDADVMIAGAAEAGITPMGIAAFHRTGAMSTRNDDPAHACRPFDGERDGFVMGEGAGALVLETALHAERRGARVLAELAGYGATADAYHITAPREDGDGAVRAMRLALAKARAVPEDVGYVNAHGTGTLVNDAAESRALAAVFGDLLPRLPVSSTKGMHGHCMGAAGGIEAVLSVLALRRSVLPPTINYAVADPNCPLDVVPNVARAIDGALELVLSNSFGFGGHNACLAFRAWSDDG